MYHFLRTDSENLDFKNLVALLDQDLALRDGEEHQFYAQYNGIEKIRSVIIAYHARNPVGIGAFRDYGNETVEIKRMFVIPEYRGKGIAFQILKELEAWAKESGYRTCILETGKKQPEAIALYKKSGYHLISNYGPYKNVENSVCMSKIIVQNFS